MAIIVISPTNVANSPKVGGHFWVFVQYAHGLRQMGCEVYWLEHFRRSKDQAQDEAKLSTFFKRMKQYGLDGKTILYTSNRFVPSAKSPYEYVNVSPPQAEAIFRQADLLLNFDHTIDPSFLSYFRRTALVDIDPGLLQFWISNDQIQVPQHDLYFTIGETVGTPSAKFSDCGLHWEYIRPPICLNLWPYAYDAQCETFTTVSSWWGGGGEGEWVTDKQEFCYENNKRVSFLEFVKLPCMTNQVLELALFLGEGDPEDEQTLESVNCRERKFSRESVTNYTGDVDDRQVLESHGWRIRHASQVAATPQMYQSYVQRSRGEFSCAKPSCMKFQNAWVSDRTLCYLASGKPVVVQHTGSSSFLPNGEGMFRFSTLEAAAHALASINSDYERHCRAAREIAKAYFDSKKVLVKILDSVPRKFSKVLG